VRVGTDIAATAVSDQRALSELVTSLGQASIVVEGRPMLDCALAR
jgi:hypothetical protein